MAEALENIVSLTKEVLKMDESLMNEKEKELLKFVDETLARLRQYQTP